MKAEVPLDDLGGPTQRLLITEDVGERTLGRLFVPAALCHEEAQDPEQLIGDLDLGRQLCRPTCGPQPHPRILGDRYAEGPHRSQRELATPTMAVDLPPEHPALVRSIGGIVA